MRLVYAFSDSQEPALSAVGGKGLSLIRMTRAGLGIPSGFVLTVEFFESWIDWLRGLPLWQALVHADGDAALRDACDALKAQVADLEFSQAQRKAIAEHLSAFPANTLFAVRSSSPEEDLEGASFAGGYETVLGVVPSQIEPAVRRAFASCLDARVAIYKREHGFDVGTPRIAVVVQRQIASEVAGVGFSLNPITNAYDEACFSANWGLGQTVVSGIASPDLFTVDKVSRRVLARQVGKKETSLWLAPEGGTFERPDPRHEELTLTDAQILELTEQIVRIEALYGRPMDIEWAWAGRRLHLLQARPITAHLPLPDDMVTAPGEPKRLYWDVTISVQGVIKPMTPLATSFFAWLLSEASRRIVGRDITTRIDTTIPTARHGRMYINLSNVLLLLSREKIVRTVVNVDPLAAASVGVADPEEYRARVDVLKPLRLGFFLRMVPRVLKVLLALLRPEHGRRQCDRGIERYLRALRKVADSHAPIGGLLRETVGRTADLVFNVVLPRFVASRIAVARLRRLFPDPTPEERRLLGRLDQSLPGNVTVEMGLALATLARLLPREGAEGALAALTDVDALEQLMHGKRLPVPFLGAWSDFLARYGHRGPGEVDIATPRYREQPRMLLQQMVQLARAGDTETSPIAIYERSQRERCRAYEILHAAVRARGRLAATLFRTSYRAIEILGAYRETPKFYIVLVIDMLRRRVLADAETLVATGRLGRPEQVFDLTFEDLERAVAEPSLDLRALAAERRQTIDRLGRVRELPQVLDSRGRIFRPKPQPLREGELAGHPISPGVVRGSVKVLHAPDEKPLSPGEILVARATDPGWTPLFVNAAAVVLEVGGVMQHGALVAREYGKPCVAGVDAATERLTDGVLVEVDGAAGLVRVVG